MLSVLIPVYNYPVSDLIESIHKMLDSNSIAYEIIILEDGSTITEYIDNNRKAAELSNCKFLVNSLNKGRTQSRNFLAETAQFENLLFLDSDVLPADSLFIEKYSSFLKTKFDVICGGYMYQNEKPEKDKILRWTYGKEREEAKAEIRNEKPFQYIFSGNLLIKKDLFLKVNFNENQSLYGMDVFIAYRLFIENTIIQHINNPIIHLGLEKNEIFFDKCLEAVRTRKKHLLNKPEIEQINPLLFHYKRLKKYNLDRLFKIIFKISEPFLKRRILSSNPSLFCLDLYRLGYICSIKNT